MNRIGILDGYGDYGSYGAAPKKKGKKKKRGLSKTCQARKMRACRKKTRSDSGFWKCVNKKPKCKSTKKGRR